MLIFENYFLIHRQAFDLLEFDIQELEESLLLMGSEDDSTQLVQRLVIKLLKGCSNTFTKNITEDVSKSKFKQKDILHSLSWIIHKLPFFEPTTYLVLWYPCKHIVCIENKKNYHFPHLCMIYFT